jgi:hypothetical protein
VGPLRAGLLSPTASWTRCALPVATLGQKIIEVEAWRLFERAVADALNSHSACASCEWVHGHDHARVQNVSMTEVEPGELQWTPVERLAGRKSLLTRRLNQKSRAITDLENHHQMVSIPVARSTDFLRKTGLQVERGAVRTVKTTRS